MKSKPRSKLSYKEIEALKPIASKQTEHIGEGVLIKIEPIKRGGGKYFIGKYRVPNKKQPRDYQIGIFGDKKPKLTPSEAILKWREVREWCEEENKTPRDYKIEQKKKLSSNLIKPTFKKAVDLFLAIRRSKVKATTLKEYKRKLYQVVDWENSSFFQASNY